MRILHDDGALLVVDKPSGILVHRSPEADDRIFLLQVVRDLAGRHVYPVHRLDRAASGATVFAGTREAACELGAAMRQGRFEKTYLALVQGVPRAGGRIDLPLTNRENGRQTDCVTDFARVEAAQGCALVLARPVTGRRHQIRRHLKKIHHPILGDTSYGRGEVNRAWRESAGLHRLALHSLRVRLPHPSTGAPAEFLVPPPEDLAGAIVRIPPLGEALAALLAGGIDGFFETA